jgi:hypothetical protein
LSFCVIDHVERTVQACNSGKIESIACLVDAHLMLDLLSLKPTERAIMTPLIYLYSYGDKIQSGHTNIPNVAAVEGHGKKLLAISKLFDYDDDCLVWAALVIRDTASKGSVGLKFATKVLDASEITEERTTELERAFLPLPSTYKWLWKNGGPSRDGAH